MKDNKMLTMERLREAVACKGGCTPVFLRVLKSDLATLLNKYMATEDIDLMVSEAENGYIVNIGVRCASFYDIGRG